jgi:hypothetical protein
LLLLLLLNEQFYSMVGIPIIIGNHMKNEQYWIEEFTNVQTWSHMPRSFKCN